MKHMYAHFLVTFRFAQRDKMNDLPVHWNHRFKFILDANSAMTKLLMPLDSPFPVIILECQFTNHKTAYYIGLTSFNRFWFILAVADGFKNLSTLDSPFQINFEFPTSFCRILSFRLTRQVQVLEERTALFHWAVTFHKVKRAHEGWTPQTDPV